MLKKIKKYFVLITFVYQIEDNFKDYKTLSSGKIITTNYIEYHINDILAAFNFKCADFNDSIVYEILFKLPFDKNYKNWS